MDLPPDVGTDDEKFFTSEEEIELPPDVDTDAECFDTGGNTTVPCGSCDAIASANAALVSMRFQSQSSGSVVRE